MTTTPAFKTIKTLGQWHWRRAHPFKYQISLPKPNAGMLVP